MGVLFSKSSSVKLAAKSIPQFWPETLPENTRHQNPEGSSMRAHSLWIRERGSHPVQLNWLTEMSNFVLNCSCMSLSWNRPEQAA